MKNLTEFLLRHFHWILFAVLEVIGIVMLVQYNHYQNGIWVSSANSIAGNVYSYTSKVDAYFHLTTVNENLSKRNVYLETRLAELNSQLADQHTDSLPQTIYNQPLNDFKLIPAKVVSNSIDKRDNLITINRGTTDGIKENMGVVSGQGIVGVIFKASRHYAVVLPVLNSHSNISCLISGTNYFGFLHWDGGYRHMAYVDDIPRHAKFKPHDYIVTSGYSSIFPKGLLVGQIRYVFNSPDGLSYRLKIQLATDFANLRDVTVIDNTHLQEQIDVLLAAEDSLKQRHE